MGCTTSTPAQPPMIQSLEVSKESKGIVFTDNINEYGASPTPDPPDFA